MNIFKTYTGFPLLYFFFVLTNSIYVILNRVKKDNTWNESTNV